jgi:hypothetical protein
MVFILFITTGILSLVFNIGTVPLRILAPSFFYWNHILCNPATSTRRTNFHLANPPGARCGTRSFEDSAEGGALWLEARRFHRVWTGVFWCFFIPGNRWQYTKYTNLCAPGGCQFIKKSV